MSLLDAGLREQDRIKELAAALDDNPASELRRALEEAEPLIAEPEPLRRPLASAGEYPLDALEPILSGVARRIHGVIQAPAAMCGQSVLAAASLATQALANVCIDGRSE
jgi:hypothetical protein